MPDPYSWVENELAELQRRGLRRIRRIRQGPQQAVITLDGRRLVSFGSNDYLGLAAELAGASEPPWQEPAAGWGSGASPMICGRSPAHAALEEALARFEGTQSALLFTSGYAANLGVVTALAGKGDCIFSDEKNHASIIDGCRLSGAHIEVYAHADVDDLRSRLKNGPTQGRRLIVSDSLFSMDGDLAPLDRLAEIAEEHSAMLLIDEAHATGVFGTEGRGLAEHFGVEAAAAVRVGTLSKALGSLGGFAVGPATIIDWLAHRARSYFFSTAPPDVLAVAALRALECVQSEPQRRRELLSRAAELRDRLRGMGLPLGNSQSQIIPVILGEADRTMEAAARLADAGLFVPGIRPPSVPPGQSLLRISLSYGHTAAQIESLVDALRSPG
jgi:8-amino-7-oxononanoate synthase